MKRIGLWVSVAGLTVFIFISCAVVAAPLDGRVALMLQGLTDTNCDGQPDSSSTSSIAPGACLIYQLDAVNQGAVTVSNVAIAARIPEHTELVAAFQQVDGGEPPVSEIEDTSHGPRLLKTRLHKLEPGVGNTVRLQYRVRVL